MSPSPIRLGAPVIRGVLAMCLVAAIVACRDVPEADARTPYERLASDSAHADSGAFATLPAKLGEVLDVRALLEPTVLQSLPLADCVDLSAPTPDETRRRLQMRLADSTAIVLYAVGDRTTGVLGHVEFIRRMPGNGQRGFTWDVVRDRTTSLWLSLIHI